MQDAGKERHPTKPQRNALTPRERRFLAAYFGGMSQWRAYLVTTDKPITESSAKSLASKMLKRIRRKTEYRELLDAANLGDTRLLREVNKRFRAMRTEFYQGEAVAVVTDNTNRQRNTELLADLLGRRKTEIELSGAVAVKGYIGISPDDWDDPMPAPAEPAGGSAVPPADGEDLPDD